MRVSVVVPVYNPGHYISDLIASLRAQTLDAAEWEAVLVDDGSSDGTAALLDRVAGETPNLRVLHVPHSGWPGRPRNIGIDAARGDYVFLSDHDDRLDPGALERLTAFADEHGSDVVIGKVVGVGRPVPERVFARTVVDAQHHPGLLMGSLTPHKLFRRAFLDQQDIRFPEGIRRLEDHLFVTKAYLRARRVSIYAEHPVYRFVLRDDGRNASRRPIEWRGYFENAAESIRVVDAEAPDEATRIVMRRRWLQTEAVGRLRGSRLLGCEDRAGLMAGVRDLLQRHYPIPEIDLLSVGDRVAARLLLDGRDADVLAFAEWEASACVHPEVLGASPDAARRAVEVRVRATRRSTVPLPAVLLDPPAGYPSRVDIDRILAVPAGARLEVRLEVRLDGGPAARVERSVEAGVLEATAYLELAAASRDGGWRFVASVAGAGRIRREPLRVAPGAEESIDTAPVRTAAARIRLQVADDRTLLLRVRGAGVTPAMRRAVRGARRLARAPRRVVRRVGRRIRLRRS